MGHLRTLGRHWSFHGFWLGFPLDDGMLFLVLENALPLVLICKAHSPIRIALRGSSVADLKSIVGFAEIKGIAYAKEESVAIGLIDEQRLPPGCIVGM